MAPNDQIHTDRTMDLHARIGTEAVHLTGSTTAFLAVPDGKAPCGCGDPSCTPRTAFRVLGAGSKGDLAHAAAAFISLAANQGRLKAALLAAIAREPKTADTLASFLADHSRTAMRAAGELLRGEKAPGDDESAPPIFGGVPDTLADMLPEGALGDFLGKILSGADLSAGAGQIEVDVLDLPAEVLAELREQGAPLPTDEQIAEARRARDAGTTPTEETPDA